MATRRNELFTLRLLIATFCVTMVTLEELPEEDKNEFILVVKREANPQEDYDEAGSGSGDDTLDFTTIPPAASNEMTFTSVNNSATSRVQPSLASTSSNSDVTQNDGTEQTVTAAISQPYNGEDITTETVDITTSESNQNTKSTFVVTSPVQVSTTQATPTAPVAVIRAPSSIVPTCGTFTLSGAGSYSVSSSIVKYTWSVESDVDYSALQSTLQGKVA